MTSALCDALSARASTQQHGSGPGERPAMVHALARPACNLSSLGRRLPRASFREGPAVSAQGFPTCSCHNSRVGNVGSIYSYSSGGSSSSRSHSTSHHYASIGGNQFSAKAAYAGRPRESNNAPKRARQLRNVLFLPCIMSTWRQNLEFGSGFDSLSNCLRQTLPPCQHSSAAGRRSSLRLVPDSNPRMNWRGP